MSSRGYKFELGETVKDKVTGFKGVVVGRSNHISGCDTFGVQASTLKDGAPQDPKWFDEPRLESTGKRMDIVDGRTVKTGADSVPQSTR
jgi:hypothetical protein